MENTVTSKKKESFRVLVLNADFTPLRLLPLSTISWQEAVCLIFKGNARAVSNYNENINTVSNVFPMPAVIVLTKYKKVRSSPKYSKYNIKLRDDFTCQYCGEKFSAKALTVDHVIPRAKGGKTTWDNISTACAPCNQRKQDDHRIVPKKRPIKPTYYELSRKMLNTSRVTNPYWIPYIEHMTSPKMSVDKR